MLVTPVTEVALVLASAAVTVVLVASLTVLSLMINAISGGIESGCDISGQKQLPNDILGCERYW